MARRPSPKLVPFKAIDGGQLFTNPSSEAVGAANYVVKNNWRRSDNFEHIREGHDYFWINRTGDYATLPGSQPFPNLATSKTASTVTYASGVVTVTFASTHTFQVGEMIRVEGASEDQFSGEFTVASIGYKTLTYAPVSAPSVASTGGSITVRSAEPINLITMAVRPDGHIALVVGTKTNLFRFLAADGDPYIVADYWEDGYVDELTAGWVVIGSGYSTEGHRWEMENLNGYLILNNGIDLPLTYRVEDYQVYPIYELRENGIASALTISVYNTVLHLGNIRQLKTDQLLPWMLPIGIELQPSLTAYQSATAVTFSSAAVSASDVNKYIEYDDGDLAKITAYTDPQNVTVDTSLTKVNSGFRLKIKGSQVGAYSSIADGGLTATLDHTTMTVTLSAAPATAGLTGDTFRFANGFESVITAINSTTEYVLTVADDPGEDFDAQVFWITNTLAHIVVAQVALFTEEMVGRTLYFESGETRIITEYINAMSVYVDRDTVVASDFVSVENVNAYGRIEDDTICDHIHWRMYWGELEQPRRWKASIGCKVVAGSRVVTLDYAALSLSDGDEIIILGAGDNGGNVTANILSIAGDRYLKIDQDITTTLSTELAQSDSIGGLTGYVDLEDDGSGILKMKPLQDTHVIYKDTAMFLENYLGDPTASEPFAIRRRLIPPNTGLYYRHSLIVYENNWHIYAGRESFYRFNLTDQTPQIMPSMEGCRSDFFTEADRADTDDIYAADNALTKESWFNFPNSDVGSIILDQRYGQVSTTDRKYNAMGTVIRPVSDAVQEESDSLCLAAIGERLVIYGKADIDMAGWDSAREIFYLRDRYPAALQKMTYTCKLQSGLEAFGDGDSLKTMIDYILTLSSWSEECPLTVTLLGAENPTNTPDEMDIRQISEPSTKNLISSYFKANYIADRIEVEARGQKVSISKREFRTIAAMSRSIMRSPGSF